MTYIEAIGFHWPNVQCHAIGTLYTDLVWDAGDIIPTKAELDAWILNPTSEVNDLGSLASGLNKSVQYNKDGLLKGAASLAIDDSGGLLVSTITDIPNTPTDGFIELCRNIAGRRMPSFLGVSGAENAFQPAMFASRVLQWLPGTGTTLSIAYGDTWTARNNGNSAAQSHPTRSTSNLMSYMRRASFNTGNSSSGSSGIRSTNFAAFRGNASGIGGFFFHSRFGIETYQSAMRVFLGLSAFSNYLNVEPSTMANSIGICKDSTDTYWQILSVDSSGIDSKLNTNAVAVTGEVLDFFMFCKPNDSKVTVRLTRVGTGEVIVDNVDITNRLPMNTAGLYAQALIQSTSGSTAKSLALANIYLESDN